MKIPCFSGNSHVCSLFLLFIARLPLFRAANDSLPVRHPVLVFGINHLSSAFLRPCLSKLAPLCADWAPIRLPARSVHSASSATLQAEGGEAGDGESSAATGEGEGDGGEEGEEGGEDLGLKLKKKKKKKVRQEEELAEVENLVKQEEEGGKGDGEGEGELVSASRCFFAGRIHSR